MKWVTLLLIIVALLLLPVSMVLADTSDQVVITVSGFVVEIPINFTLTHISDYEIQITWTKPESANNTMIRAKYGSWPIDRSDGYLVYYGTDNVATDNSVSLDHNLIDLHYRAWSENTEGEWSPQYAQDRIGGAAMQIAIVLIVLGLTVLAFWRKEPLLYMVGVIGWLFMTFYLVNQYYPEENEYLKWAIAGFCLSMVVVMVVQTLRTYFSGKEGIPTSQDIQTEHRKKVLQLTQKRKKPWYEE